MTLPPASSPAADDLFDNIIEEALIHFQKDYIGNYSRILEIGCRSGKNLRMICAANQRCKITGVDISGPHIDEAKRNLPTATFIRADFQTLNLINRFDTIILSLTLARLDFEDTAALIAKLSTLTARGGNLFLNFAAPAPAPNFAPNARRPKNIQHLHSKDNIKELLTICSFKVVEEKEYPMEQTDEPVLGAIIVLFAVKRGCVNHETGGIIPAGT